MKSIVDLSHHQNPLYIKYDTFCSQLDMAIIRIQDGNSVVDRSYKRHIAEMKAHNIPFGVYAFVRCNTQEDARTEAQLFYDRAKDQNPSFYALDVETIEMADMRGGVKAYVKKLRSLTDKKIGIYVAHHLYTRLNLDMADFDFVWIPRYGGSKPAFYCDLHQYTSSGRLNGYGADLDLNVLMNGRTVEFFTGKQNTVILTSNPYKEPTKTLKYNPLTVRTVREDVKWLQFELNRVGYAIEIDGKFGKATNNALFDFQNNHPVTYLPSKRPDGKCGKNTRLALKTA